MQPRPDFPVATLFEVVLGEGDAVEVHGAGTQFHARGWVRGRQAGLPGSEGWVGGAKPGRLNYRPFQIKSVFFGSRR